MAQVTKAVAQGILAGQGYTDNEVRQLAHYWLAKNGGADTPQAGAESYPSLPEPAYTRIGVDVMAGDTPSRMQQVPIQINGVQAFTADQMRAFADATAALRARGAVPSEREYHAALQRVGTALGLEPGSNILTDCVPEIEALRAAAPMSAQAPSGLTAVVMPLISRACAEHVDYHALRATNWMGGKALSARNRYRATLDQIEALLAAAPQPPAELPGEQDAERYRLVRRGQHWSVVDGIGDHLRGDELDAAVDAKLARRAKGLEGGAPAIERHAAFEAVRQKLWKVPRYSFALDSRGNVRRCEDKCGNWIEFDAAHELFDPVAIDAAMAAAKGRTDGGA